LVQADVTDEAALTAAFQGCDGVAHCAGINRELGRQTYARVHVEGTAAVARAARTANVGRLAMVSFLGARPNCGSAYHQSKWAAEKTVRAAGIPFAILKCGIVYGRGDHLLDHLGRTLHTFPLFATVGWDSRPVAPAAVEDVVRILCAALLDGALDGQTVAVTGPEQLTFADVVRRVARAIARPVWIVPMPYWFHRTLAWILERAMRVPLISVAQVRILAEGAVDAPPGTGELPPELKPVRRFNQAQILAGLPAVTPFGRRDLRCCRTQ
jgi:NADH dehydrogenase